MDIVQQLRERAEYVFGPHRTTTRMTYDLAAHEIERLRGILERSGLDITRCDLCGEETLGLDGDTAMCLSCAKAEAGGE